jgi:hypothetical protein
MGEVGSDPSALANLSKLLHDILKIYYLYLTHQEEVLEGYLSLREDYEEKCKQKYYPLPNIPSRFRGLLGLEDAHFGLIAASVERILTMLSQAPLFQKDLTQAMVLRVQAMHAAYVYANHLGAIVFNEDEKLPLAQRFAPFHRLFDLSTQLVFQSLSEKSKMQVNLFLSFALDALYRARCLSYQEKSLFNRVVLSSENKIDYSRLLLLLGLAESESNGSQQEPKDSKAFIYLNLVKTLSKAFREKNTAHAEPLLILETIARERIAMLESGIEIKKVLPSAVLLPMFRKRNEEAPEEEGHLSGKPVCHFTIRECSV